MTTESQARRVYFSTSTRPLYLENSDPLTLGERVTLIGEPRGNAVAHIETGRLVPAPDDEQPKAEPAPGPAASKSKSSSKSTTDQGA